MLTFITLSLAFQNGRFSLNLEAETCAQYNLAFIARDEKGVAPNGEYASEDKLVEALHYQGSFKWGAFTGYQWNPQSLYPTFIPDDNSKRDNRIVGVLAGIISKLSAGGASLLLSDPIVGQGGGYPVSHVDSGAASQMIDTLMHGDPRGNQDPKATFSVSADFDLQIANSSGKTVEISLSPSRKNSPAMQGFFRSMINRDNRVPPSMTQSLRSASITPKAGMATMTVKQFVDNFVARTGLKIFVDRRLANDQLVVEFPANFEAPCYDFAEAVAKSLDLYWRQVGDVYFLAISPEAPWKMMAKKFLRQRKKDSLVLMRALEANGLLPGGLTADEFAQLTGDDCQISPSQLAAIVDDLPFKDAAAKAAFIDQFCTPGDGVSVSARLEGSAMVDLDLPTLHLSVGQDVSIGP